MGEHPSLTGQLRDLDRHRSASIARLRRVLARKGTSKGAAVQVPTLKFEGFPFSYAGLAERQPGTSEATGLASTKPDRTQKLAESSGI